MTIQDAIEYAAFGQNWPRYNAIIDERATANVAGNDREYRRLSRAMRGARRDAITTTRALGQLEHLAGQCPTVGCHQCEKENHGD